MRNSMMKTKQKTRKPQLKEEKYEGTWKVKSILGEYAL